MSSTASAPRILDRPRLTPAVQILAGISAAVLFLQLTLVRYADMAAWFGFDAANLPGRWWSVLTYAFVHASGWHLAANVYGLLVFGPRLERGWGARRFVWLYFVCAVGGALVHMLFVRGSGLVGSSAAVFGIMTAYAMQWPNEEVRAFGMISMRARTLVGWLIAVNLAVGLFGTGDGTNLAYFAQLGGILAAYAYMRMPDGSAMDQVRQRVAELPEENEPPRAIPRTLPRSRERLEEVDEIVAKSKAIAAKHPAVATPTKRSRRSKHEELDRVLDKISQHGLDSLTPDERLVLDEMSKRLRND